MDNKFLQQKTESNDKFDEQIKQVKIGREFFGDTNLKNADESELGKFISKVGTVEYRKISTNSFVISKAGVIFPSILINLMYDRTNPDESHVVVTMRRKSGLSKDFQEGDQEIFYFESESLDSLKQFLKKHIEEINSNHA